MALGAYERASAASAPTVTNLAPIVDRVSTPVRLATDLLGNFYVTDPRAGGILKYDNGGRYLATITTAKPTQGIAVTAAGDLVVAQGDAVAVLSATGTVKFQLNGQFKLANGVALDASGNIYVTDSLNDCVQAFSASGVPLNMPSAAPGKPVNSFGSTGSGLGFLSRPTGIAFEKLSGQLAVADTLNNRIQFFGTDGAPIKSVGSSGVGGLHFTAPEGVAFSYGTSGSLMYVVDTFQSNVQVIDLTGGAFLRVIGSYGKGSGKLVAPTDAVFDPYDARNQRLVVANGFGNLTLYGIDLPSGPTTSPGSALGGPALTVDAVPLATNLTSLTLSGTRGYGASIAVAANTAAAVGPVTYASATTWSVFVSALPAGSNQFTVSAIDASGNSSSVAVSTTVIASTSPVTPLTVDPLPAIVGTAQQTLSGTVQAGSTVSVNGAQAAVTGGTWRFPATLTVGVNSFAIAASNPSFSDATTSVNITLDTAPPLLSLSALPNGSVSSTQLLSVSGTVADILPSTVNLRLNGAALAPVPVVNGAFSAGVLLANGTNTLVISASDGATNASAEVTQSVVYQPQGPSVAFTTPDQFTVNATLAVAGTATSGSTVTVNGVPASLSGGKWGSSVSLAPGLNTIVACATEWSLTTCARLSVQYDPTVPALSIVSPPSDAVFPSGHAVTVSGTTGAGTTVGATLDGTSVPVLAGAGQFSVTVGQLPLGSHTLAVTAVDAFGNAATAVRGLVSADPAPPLLAVASTSPVKVSVGNGSTLIVRDKNGPVGSVVVSGTTSSIDLTGVTYDAASLNITAVTPAGLTSRNGVVLDSELAAQATTPTILDALTLLKLAVGLRAPTFSELLHGDVAPQVNGVPAPDGKIGVDDVLTVLRRAVGL